MEYGYFVWYGDNYNEPEISGTREVYETDRSPTFTGLYDVTGQPLYSVPETVPFGFHKN